MSLKKPSGTPEQTDWSGWRLLDKRPYKEIWWKYEPGNPPKEHFREVWIDDPAIELAQQVRDGDGPRRGHQEAMRHAMVIPMSMIAQSIREGWYTDTAKWRRIVNDIDYRKLKTSDGHW